MSNSVNLELVVRDYLRMHSIKIWELDDIPDNLIDKLTQCVKSQCSREQVADTLWKVQRDVRSRLSGVETGDNLHFTVKVVSSDSNCAPERIPVSIDKLASADILGQLIISKLDISSNQSPSVRLIFKGRIIPTTDRLVGYPLNRNSLVMCFVSFSPKQDPTEMAREQTSSVREAAELLSSRNTGSSQLEEYGLDILDQDGKPVKMKRGERKRLTTALTLVEQGKRMMGSGKFSEALFTLMYADEDFKSCDSALLELVDNYALLQLDIVWCYLRLESVDQLPDAMSRLELCEKKLKKIFGPNLMRVEVIKGKALQEKALFVRLNMLKGIVLFYLKRYPESLKCLFEARTLKTELEVDEFRVAEMVMMGFEENESRLALRSSGNDLNAAVDQALGERDRRAKVERETKEERQRSHLQEKLGFTLDNAPVNVEHYTLLRSVGYTKLEVVLCLKRFNNDMDECLRVLSQKDYSSLLQKEVIQEGAQCNQPVDEMQLALLMSLFGNRYSTIEIAAALFVHQNNPEKAQELLNEEKGLNKVQQLMIKKWSGRILTEEDFRCNVDEEAKRKEEDCRKKEKEAMNKLKNIVSNEGGSDYLDLDFQVETPYIEQYLALLSSI